MAKSLPENAPAQPASGSKDRPWIPRFWDGMNIRGWYGLLLRNRFAIAPHRWGMAFLICIFTFVNFFFWAIQTLIYGRRIARTRITEDPIFVIGHWRSGTTLLHELLVRDRRHTYPDTYACFAPNHFLASAWFFKPWVKFLLPPRRLMDNMPAGWNRPQEDEFALCNMGARSPYLTLIFPNRPPQDTEYLDLERAPAWGVERWKTKLDWFLRCLTVRRPQRIVLKSPAHTCRIKVLLEMFPRAKFVHIVRDPSVIFPSTMHLWKRLYRDEGLQAPRYEGLEEHVFRTFERMYEVFERDRKLLGPEQLCDVRYEDLIRHPLETMRRIYEELQLGEFEQARPAMEDYMAGQKGYKTNRYEITPEIREAIGRRWSTYIEQYGYGQRAERNHSRPPASVTEGV
ncbi:MAG: sulfotransferase [Pirellulales bacterium]|nr:sulfotransferase [Pirellulales bacterium]